jgi:cytoskeletal protein CcmA (bactofilin family)
MYRIIGAILMISLMIGSLILVADNKLAAQNTKLTSGIVVPAPRTVNLSNLFMMPKIVVTANKPKLNKISGHSDSQISYAALDIPGTNCPGNRAKNLLLGRRAKFQDQLVRSFIPAFADKFDANSIDKLAALKIKGDYKLPKDETVKEDVVVSGGNATIDGVIEGNLAVMGGTVDINGSVEGDVAVFGGNLTVLGSVENDAAVFGGNIRNKGMIEGDLFVAGGTVALDSGSVVEGEISMIGGSVNRDTNAVVNGEIKSIDIGQLNKVLPKIATAFRFPGRFSGMPGLPWSPARHIFGTFITLSALIVLYVLNLLVLVIFPKPIEHIVGKIQSNVWISVACGVGIEILYVPLIVLFAVSIIGIPIIPLFILAVLVGLLFGSTAISMIIGERIKKGFNWQVENRIGIFSLGWIAIMIIPLLGSLLRGVSILGPLVSALGLVIIYVTHTIGLGGVLYSLIKKN